MYFRKISQIIFIAVAMTLQTLPMLAVAEVAIIVHPSNDSTLDKSTIKKIFMGKVRKFPNGNRATPIALEEGATRDKFLSTVLRRSEGSLQAYWSRMMFSGKATPPKAYKRDEDIKSLVAKNNNYIGYIDSSLVDDSVKVVKFD